MRRCFRDSKNTWKKINVYFYREQGPGTRILLFIWSFCVFHKTKKRKFIFSGTPCFVFCTDMTNRRWQKQSHHIFNDIFIATILTQSKMNFLNNFNNSTWYNHNKRISDPINIIFSFLILYIERHSFKIKS